MSDDKIVDIPVRFKAKDPDAPILKVVDRYETGKCNHLYTLDGAGLSYKPIPITYIIDRKTGTVECSNCQDKLDPIWVLEQLCNQEGQWRMRAERYHDEMKRLRKRQRTKCERCGEMTRISGR